MVHICAGCGAKADTRSDVSHYKDCPSKFKIKKFCSKSGKHPHD